MKSFLTNKEDIESVRLINSHGRDISSGEIRMEIKKCAFTSNNITYAVLGKRFKYWDFFPHNEGGIIPVWGYGVVSESKCSNVQEGEEFYGYYPMASQLILNPKKINEFGMIDGMLNRASLPGVYNYYEKIGNNFFDPASLKNAYMVFQPLFATSFLLEDYYADNNYFGAKELFITSASSKTAIALAFMIKHNSSEVHVTGVTSDDKVEFCKGLNCFDNIRRYSEILDFHSDSCAIVDFAGNIEVLGKMQTVLLNSLVICSTVGLSHWKKRLSDKALPFKNKLFFAPAHAKKRQSEWGGKSFKKKINKALLPFLKWTMSWMVFEEKKIGEIKESYENVLNGKISPAIGIVFLFNN